ncbi:MAG: SDR family oxidoreductase [Chloroflexales bacterium]|nr:SDR family oxidoreductase [Chloroflexales bacterium]
MQRLFITGGTGYLGRALVRHASMLGQRVAASNYCQSPPDDQSVTWLGLDIRDQDAVSQACEVLRPDVVIHTAFRQSGPDLWAVTAEGAQHVARAAQACGARLIHMSSDVIFDGERMVAYTEADQPSPITAYGEAKAAAERFVAESHSEAVIVRTSLIYGFNPIDRQTQFVLDLADGKRDERLFRDEYRCPIWVADLAAALLELAQHDYRGILNIAGGECLSRYEFGILLAQANGRDPTRITSGLSAESSTRRPRNCALDIRRASNLLRTPLRGVRAVLTDQKLLIA